MKLLHRITVSPERCGKRPCPRGMRVRVTGILDRLASGSSRDEMLADAPYLEAEGSGAALELASVQADHADLRVA
jgi:uncharacterized protein (DUF433 family)